jgi:hypothetical protein
MATPSQCRHSHRVGLARHTFARHRRARRARTQHLGGVRREPAKPA